MYVFHSKISCLPKTAFVGNLREVDNLYISSRQAEHYLLLPLAIPDELTVQEVSVGLGRGKTKAELGIVVVYGVQDNLVVTYDSPGATFCNRPWAELFKRTGIEPAEIWLPEDVSSASLSHSVLD